MKMKKIIFIFIIFANMFLAGCTLGHEINTLGIAISMGIDKSKDGYSLTYQIINPKVISSKKTVNEAPAILYTENGGNLLELQRKITEQSPRRIFNQHLQTVVISEEVAKDGIKDILEFIARSPEYRGTDLYLVIAKGTTAYKVLSVLTPLESVSGTETFNSIEISEKEWAATKPLLILELISDLIADGKNSIGTSVEIINSQKNEDSIDALKKTDTLKLKISTLGVFKEDKFVGWLTEDESKGYNYIFGNVKDTVGYFQYDEQSQITFEVTNGKSKVKAYLLNGKPAIKVNIKVKTSIIGQKGNIDLTNEDIIATAERGIGEKIKGLCEVALKCTQEDFESDIFGFGEEIHRAYPKLWKEIKSDWDNEFSKLPVNVKVDVEIENLGEDTKSIFTKGSH